MIYVEGILLSCMLFFGIYCSWTDIKKGIVPNKIILIGFLTGLPFHAVLLLCGYAPCYPFWAYNMLIADIIGFLMYLANIWAAGDEKLFMLLYFFLPPRLFDQGSLSYGVVLFIYIFVPALLWMIIDSIIRLIRHEEHRPISFSFKRFAKHLVIIVAETTAFYSLMSLLFPDEVEQQALLFATFMLIYAYLCGTVSFMKRWWAIAAHLIFLAVLLILGKWQFALPSWRGYLIILSAMILQRFCSLYNYQLIPTASVKTGMIPSAETVLLFSKSRIHSLPQDASEELTARVNEEEAEAIRRWERSSNGKPSIWIVRKTPFAIMILAGFVSWIIVRFCGR